MSNNATPAGYGWSSPFIWIESAPGSESSPCELLPCVHHAQHFWPGQAD